MVDVYQIKAAIYFGEEHKETLMDFGDAVRRFVLVTSACDCVKAEVISLVTGEIHASYDDGKVTVLSPEAINVISRRPYEELKRIFESYTKD